jgi:shikimate kinase
MRIFLAGVSCVGKTTIGAKLAESLACPFFDLDIEIERFFNTPIERLRQSCLTAHEFSLTAAQALKHVLAQGDSRDGVIALPPSGLMGGYWKVVGKAQDAAIVLLKDKPENIVKRITFYDIDSRPIPRRLTDCETRLYLREIKRDIAYFGRSFKRAHVTVDIAGCGPDEASRKVRDALALRFATEQRSLSKQPLASMH